MSVSQLCTNFLTKEIDVSKVLDKNIIEFVTATWGLGLGTHKEIPPLYPVQRFILKCYYGLELDNGSNRDIIINDKFNENELYRFNEVEYLRFLSGEGRLNVDNPEGDRENLVLVCGRRSGKCITGDSLVLTDSGISRIESLGKAPVDGFSPCVVGVAQEASKRSKSVAFYNGGIKPTYHIRTYSGYNITGTANHRIKVMSETGCVEWRYLDDIREKDVIAINRNTDLWASEKLDITPYHKEVGFGFKEVYLPSVLDERLGNLMGYLVGDDTWGDKGAVSVTVEHPETWDHLKKLYLDIFGDFKVTLDKRTKNTGRISFHSTKYRKLLDSLGFKLCANNNSKNIPWSILKSPKPVVCSFLRGLFETDGCCEYKGKRITFSSTSFKLVHELQIILLNMGIVTSFRKKYNKKYNKYYAGLAIKGVRSRKIFSELIGFDSDKKNLPLLESIKSDKEGKSNTDSIPFQYQWAHDWVTSIVEGRKGPSSLCKNNEGRGRMVLRKALGNSCKISANEDITYSRIIKSLEVAETLQGGIKEAEHFKELLRLDYFYDKVEVVEHREDQVYDLTVPEGESFVANGMTNHNTTVVACIIAYETYRLLNKYCPQEYYGIMPEDDIRITCVSTGKDTAAELFNKVTGHLERCEFFRKYRGKPTKQRMLLRSQRDLDKYGESGRATISVNVAPCSAKGLRGHNNIIVTLDEMAFFFAEERKSDSDTSGSSGSDRNDKSIYNAVTPSVAKFKRPDGSPDGKIICISSPYGKMGKFYEEYERSWSDKSNDLLMIQAPTWEVDPSLSAQYLRNKFNENPTVYDSEFGAEFSDKRRGWLEDQTILRKNVVPGLKYKFRSLERVAHFAGVDIGLKGDATSICIGHWTTELVDNIKMEKIEVDCCESISADELGKEYLNPDEVVDWLAGFTDRFYIVKGLMDQYYGFSIVPKLHDLGHKMFEYRSFNDITNSNLYQNLYSCLLTGTVRFPQGDQRVVDGVTVDDSDLVAELLTLQSVQKSKYLIKVKAPDRKDAHDDLSDAFARLVLLASEHKMKVGSGKVAMSSSAQARSFKVMQTREMFKASLNRPSRNRSSRSGMGLRQGFPSR